MCASIDTRVKRNVMRSKLYDRRDNELKQLHHRTEVTRPWLIGREQSGRRECAP